MLPSKGYFNDIECPYLENTCGRPYCHFNHRKKQLDNVNEIVLEECSSREIPTYKPTPKSELAVRKSHIPISYVPDVYKVEKSTRSFRNNTLTDIIYKPTPISLLNSSVKGSSDSISNTNTSCNVEISSESQYVPGIGIKCQAENKNISDKNEEKYEYKPEEQEYKPSDKETQYHYNPSSCTDINEDSLSDIVYNPNWSGLNNSTKVKYTPSVRSKQNSSINFENLDNEFEMIDEIINMSDNTKNFEEDTNNIVSKKKCIEKLKNGLTTSGNNSETEKASHRNEILTGAKNSNDSNNKSRLNDRGNNSHKHKDKRNYSEESNKKEKPKNGKAGNKEERRERKEGKKDRKDEKKEKSEKTEMKVKDSSKNDKRKSESSRSKDKKINHEKKVQEERREGRSNSEKELEKKSKYKETENKKKHDTSREKDKSKHSNKKSEKTKNDDKKEKGHTKHEDKKKRESSATECEKPISGDILKLKENAERKKTLSVNFDLDVDLEIDEMQTMEECFKIFNEYKPTVTQIDEEERILNENDSVEDLFLSKKRIAHTNASNMPTKIQNPKPINKLTPGQVMNNRLKIVKASQADNEEKLISNELKNIVKRPQPSQLIKPAKKIKLSEVKPVMPSKSTSLIDDIINRTNSKPVLKKIAPVSNVINLQKAKANLKISNDNQSTEQLVKTVAQTNKTGKRQAHIPDYSLSNIPDVIDVDKSKLPVNVRSRFLTLLADECCKLYLTQKDAYKRALDEEYSCYQKCKVLVTYRNSAMLAVNRLRKEVKEREEKNLGPIGSGESSHEKQEDFEKKALYKKIQQYVLTDEELDIHGYPRESTIHGKAVIKNRKITNIVPLPQNQKKCCRCSKIYLIDDEGKAVYDEECIYHPLRKRTIRGEHIYLCCKSSDDSGCATCHTHVCETPEDAELDGFQTTLPPNSDFDPRSNAIYALDCEMCYTTKGLELTRVTVIDTNCKTVYESLVKPLNDIIDYNTRFSGITKQQMDRTSTGILQVQANILHLCNSKTILIGHSLESDMKALKIIHGTIVDTAVLFPHKMGLPHKRALRTLASDYLKKIIQNDVSGHDSAEDAITCMELIKWKVKEDSKFRI